MNPDEVVQACLERGADDVVCHVGTTTRKQIRFANNEIIASKLWDSVSASIFMVKDKRIVVTSINDLLQMDATLDELFKLARVLEPNEEYYGIAKGPFKYRAVPVGDTSIVEEDVIRDVFSLADECRAAGVLYNTSGSEEVATSSGIVSNDEGSALELSVRMFADKQASGHAVSCARDLRNFDPEGACTRAKEIALQSRNAITGEEGKYDIIFSPLCFANLLDHMMIHTSAFYIDSGLSFLKDKIGDKVASDMVTLYDDGTHPEGLGSGRYDEEGVPCQKTAVIKEGILQTYLHNTSTAKKYKTSTTANAGLIAPSPTNVVLEEGDYSFDEMLSSLKDGMYVTNTWYTRYQNYSTGEFSTIPRDGMFLIKDGELSTPLKGIRISENMLNMLSNVAAVGNDTEHIQWWEAETPTFTPHVLIKDVRITRSTG